MAETKRADVLSYLESANMVEISADGGVTWDVLQYSDAFVIRDTVTYRLVDISSYVGQEIHIGFRYIDNLGNGEGWYIDDVRVWGGDGTECDLALEAELRPIRLLHPAVLKDVRVRVEDVHPIRLMPVAHTQCTAVSGIEC